MIQEQLEFELSQYADGTLTPDRVAAIEQLLSTDSEARACVDQQIRLTSALRALPGPEIAWDELARDFSAVVTGTMDDEAKAQDRKLNTALKAISPVPQFNWQRLTQHISTAIDAQLEATDAQDDKLNAALRAAPLPAINWSRLTEHLSHAIDRAEAKAELKRRSVWSIGWVRGASALAMAAVITIIAAVGIRVMQSGPSGAPINSGMNTGPAPLAVADIRGPQVETASGKAMVEIEIGPSSSFAATGFDTPRSSLVIALPARVVDDGGGSLLE